MEEIFKQLTANMTDFQVWKIDKISSFKIWWFAHVTMKFKKGESVDDCLCR